MGARSAPPVKGSSPPALDYFHRSIGKISDGETLLAASRAALVAIMGAPDARQRKRVAHSWLGALDHGAARCAWRRGIRSERVRVHSVFCRARQMHFRHRVASAVRGAGHPSVRPQFRLLRAAPSLPSVARAPATRSVLRIHAGSLWTLTRGSRAINWLEMVKIRNFGKVISKTAR